MAIELCVNPRTVLNAYELLEAEGVIATRRGLGFFLCDDARDRVLAAMRLDFFNTTLPAFVAQMKSLGISLQEIIDRINN